MNRMSKMKELTKILGVEVGEEFRVTCIDDDCRITDSRFETITVFGEWVEAPASILYEILTGKRKIIKIPWKPKKGEEYWSVTYYGTSSCEWQGGISDLAYYAIGNCFETKEEAEANSKEVMARLEKIYTDGKPLIGEDERKAKE